VGELRILSLLSSATEIAHALGLGAYQVGRSHECDYPASVLKLPVCSRPAFPVDGSSREIDSLVKHRLASALSIYEIDGALVEQLRPTHILTQTQCKVCAVSLEDVERDLRTRLNTHASVISLEPYALADLWRDIERVGRACGAPEAAEHLIALLEDKMRQISARAARASSRPTVAAIEWLEPLMAAGNWVPELIELAGGVNLFGEAGGHSPWLNWDELKAADPDIIVALPCGFDLVRTQKEMHWLTGRPGWHDLRAVRSSNVFLCDGNQYMNRPGPRLTESLRIFAEIFHPDLFEPRFEHTGWLRARENKN
jgi:iron complex transport system substrate-binding protein